jgi:hypothetical protein
MAQHSAANQNWEHEWEPCGCYDDLIGARSLANR